MKKLILLLLIFLSLAGISKLSAVESSPQFIQGTDTLIVYKDVPGLAPSDKYTIRVRSAATNNEWVDVFTHYTYNRALDITLTPRNDGSYPALVNVAYAKHTGGWSQSYGNIEMNNNQAVEVEIAAKNGFKIGGQDFFKATVHPAQKASVATVVDGKVYFTITKPAQVVIDINGQMDDYDAAVNPIGHPVHAISLWANPVIKKPGLNNPRIRYIEPGTSKSVINAISPADYDTMYFRPGVHDLGRVVNMHSEKAYYIPGDALIYGVMSNEYTGKNAKNISLYGYGTISGAKITHYLFTDYSPNTPGDSGVSYAINLEYCERYRIQGICIIDPAAHSKHSEFGSQGYNGWLKTITWRQNGDGFGGWDYHEDCFIRSHDDASYAKGPKKRCTFWKDSHAAFFHMASIPENRTDPIIIEDCDILYARMREQGGTIGGVFQQRSEGVEGQRPVNVLFRNIRIHDKKLGMSVFYLKSDAGGASYKGIVWQNISMPATTVKQRMYGSAIAPWYGGITFDNVTIGGELLTEQNFLTHFNTNEFVKDIAFKAPGDETIFHDISVSANTGGTASGGGTFNLKTYATVMAVPAANFGFVNWTENGIPVSTNKNYYFLVTQNRSLVANFVDVNTLTNITTPSGWVSGTTNNKVDGSNRMMVVMVSGENAAADFKATSITYGGQAMTKQIDTCYTNGARTYVGIFTLNEAGVNAAISGAIAVTWSETPSAGSDVQSVLLDNVDQTTPVNAVARGAATGKTLSTSAMSVAQGDMIIMSGANYNSLTITFNNGFTKRLESNAAWGDAVSGEKVVIDATETPSFSQSFSGRMVLCAIAIKSSSVISSVNKVSKIKYNIYPNPATDKLFFNSTYYLISKIELVDLTGKIVYAANVQVQNGSVDLSGITSGIYLVKVHTAQSIYTSKVFIK